MSIYDAQEIFLDNGRPRPSIISVRPIGVGSDGATTYEVAEGFPTGGFNTGPALTIRGTVVADALGNSATAAPQEGSPFSQHVISSWGTQTEGVCVGEFAEDSLNNPAKETWTVSGSVLPLFTVTADDPNTLSMNAQPTQPPEAGSGSPAAPPNTPGAIGSSAGTSPTTPASSASPSSNGAGLTLSGPLVYLGVALLPYLLF
ncbi:hypothetical protein CCMSSC00406_0004225 [Pleurotus cornucopiae]|uniref:Uncharacterized protein n=1 Tax=Pleurotus cornucopiae TaxID=5321 RepID=A0ACB7JB60_PLECO|nr:hypothetical protein CCMSSC00406_0004225 [Pleurotus cornucopiae]